MRFEPVNKFWLARTNAELADEISRLRSYLLAAVIAALAGWGLFLWEAL